MITLSRKLQKKRKQEAISPNGKLTGKAVHAKNAQPKSMWLDRMPIGVREHIASFVTFGREWNDDGLNLAKSSELQRLAVLSSVPRVQVHVLEASDLSEAWAVIAADHVRELSLRIRFRMNLRSRAWKMQAPFLRLLRGKRLEKVSIPGGKAFLDSIRDAAFLRELCVDMRNCSRRSLLITLRRRGPSLSSLTLQCGERKLTRSGPHSSECPVSLCLGNGSNALTSLCPNLKRLRLECRHIPPSTTAFLVGKLPFLERMGVRSPNNTIELSEDDFTPLRGLDRVIIGNISRGMRVATQIGRPVVSMIHNCWENSDAASELVNCPHLSVVDLELSTTGIGRFANIVPQLPSLQNVMLRLTSEISFQEIEKSAMDAFKILRLCQKPSPRVILRCLLTQHEGLSRDEVDELEKLKPKFAMEGAAIMFFGDYMGDVLCGMASHIDIYVTRLRRQH